MLRPSLCTEQLADEVEGACDLGSTRFDLYLAPHTGVLPRAAAEGIDAPGYGLRELRVGSYALCADFPARQGVRIRTLHHVGPLLRLIGGGRRVPQARQAAHPPP